MQLVSISLYNRDGRRRDVDFKLGALNVITGEARTGKSSLLKIVDYCLGRDSAPVPRTDWFRAVDWYATVWQFTDRSRAILARPATRAGKGTSRAMLVFGGPDLAAPDYSALEVNTNSKDLRTQVGARIGLGDIELQPSEFSERGATAVGLGTAALFSLQYQEEIGGSSLLFHRQGEPGIAKALGDSIPFFLGAVDGDQAFKRETLRGLRQRLRRLDSEISSMTMEAETGATVLRELWIEASAVGLAVEEFPTDSDQARVALAQLRFERGPDGTDLDVDLEMQDRRRLIEAELIEVRAMLSTAVASRELLLEQQTGEVGYGESVSAQIGRLESIGLLPNHSEDPGRTCPVCAQDLQNPDPTAIELGAALETLRAELQGAQIVRPRIKRSIRELDGQIRELRARLNSLSHGLDSGDVARIRSGLSGIESGREFVRGRLDATLNRLSTVDRSALAELQTQRSVLAAQISALEDELDASTVREQLTSRLNVHGTHLRHYSRALHLEQAEAEMRLDVARLTIVLDTSSGPLPLPNIGSGENWVGYHVAAHLSLHHYFMRESRPVPRFLMLDQPSQAHFQSERMGTNLDKDRQAVKNMFELFYSFTENFAPDFQLIVVDHAEYEDPWFEDSVVQNWRGGRHLIPDDWQV